MAMQCKLVPQDPNDEPASVLIEKIRAEKQRLLEEGKIKKEKPLPPVAEDEIPFNVPGSWVWVRLGNLCEYIQRGKSPKYSLIKKYLVIAQNAINGVDITFVRNYLIPLPPLAEQRLIVAKCDELISLVAQCH